MIYELQIGVREKRATLNAYMEPVEISTISNNNNVTNEEIDFVTEAFAKQIKGMIKRLIKTEEG
jgi:hypothetical protein